jgi:hypothetical protein
MKRSYAILVLLSLLSLTSCSSGGGGGAGIVTPVQAQAGYSNSSVAGTYAFSIGADYGDLIGTFTADGSGNITGGTVTVVNSSGVTCTESVSGTYSIQSSGAGTTTWKVTGSGASPCNVGTVFGLVNPSVLNLEVAQQGSSLVAADNSAGSQSFAFTAIKQ